MRRFWIVGVGLTVLLAVAAACGGGEAATPVVITKEVVKEVPVEVVKTVEVPKIVEKEVIKEVPVEKIVTVEVAAPTPTPVPAGTLSPEGPKFNFTMSGQLTTTLRQWDLLEQPYFQGADSFASQRSNGRVNFDLKTATELGIGQFDVIRFLRSGVIDFAYMVAVSVAGDVPLIEGVDLAGYTTNIQDAKTVTGAMWPEVSKLTEKTLNFKMVAHGANPAQVPYCKFAIGGVDDLKGKRVRTFGSTLGDFVEAFGGTNITLAFVDVYSAMQTGIADCAITGTGSGNSQKWFEVTTHLFTLPVGWSVVGYGVNLDTWNSLPTDVQEFLGVLFDDFTADYWDLADRLTQDGIDCNTGNAAGCKLGFLATPQNKMTEVVPTQDDFDKLAVALRETVLPRWADRCGLDCKLIFNRTAAEATGIAIP